MYRGAAKRVLRAAAGGAERTVEHRDLPLLFPSLARIGVLDRGAILLPRGVSPAEFRAGLLKLAARRVGVCNRSMKFEHGTRSGMELPRAIAINGIVVARVLHRL